MADLSSGDMDRMLTEARQALERMRGGTAPSDDAPQLEATGEAADGRVRATAVTGGRLTEVTLDPRALRMASHELGEAIVTAVNAAMEELASRSAGAADEEAVDLDGLARNVEQVQNESLQQMRMFSQAMTDAVDKIGRHR